MIIKRLLFFSVVFLTCLSGCKKDDPQKNTNGTLQLASIQSGTISFSLSPTTETTGISPTDPILINFSAPVNVTSVPGAIAMSHGTVTDDVTIAFLNDNKTISVTLKSPAFQADYTLTISNKLTGASNESFPGITVLFKTSAGVLSLVDITIGGKKIIGSNRVIDVPQTLSIVADFSLPLDPATVTTSSIVLNGPDSGVLSFALSNDNKTVTITRSTPLTYLSKYSITIHSGVKAAAGVTFVARSQSFFTNLGDHTSGFPTLSDDALMDLVQSQTVKYFYDYGHPASGMARERNSGDNTVTTGGSGFGLMAMVAAVDRGFIPRTDGVARFAKIVTFLEKADRFHGAWSHWINGNTGKVIPFSTNDNGGDLVETSFLVEGLITVRQYLNSSDTVGNNLINRITKLWTGVEWDWYRQESQKNWLYWHWSPDKAWIMNFALIGYFEEQITYFLAASSPTHSIPKICYTQGFQANGTIKNDGTYSYNSESHVLPLGQPAPLFWTQYSYIGLNPDFSDDLTNYLTQNTNASLINHAYCAQNPQRFPGYSDSCWGLTASDNASGYDAQSPGNDNGTITPTAALSAFAYTPEQSMKAMRFFYDKIGDRLWGPYGFYDAFSVNDSWVASSYLAIDQGPIVGMIENHRSKLLWNLFMSAPEVQQGITVLGFH